MADREPRATRAGAPRLRRPWWVWICALVTVVIYVGIEPVRLTTAVGASEAALILGFLIAGVVSMRNPLQHRNGRLMLLYAFSGSLSSLIYVSTGPWAFLGYVLGPATLPPLILLMLRWPRARLQTRAQRWVVGASVAIPLSSLVENLSYDPTWYDDPAGPWWPVLIRSRLVNDLAIQTLGVSIVAVVLVVAILVGVRFVRAARPERRELIPVAAVLVVNMVVVGWSTGHYLVTGSEALVALEAQMNLAFLAFPFSLLVSVVVRRVQRALAVEALLQPQQLPDPDAVRRALSRALGDKGLTLALWSPVREAFLAADGTPADSAEPRRHDVAVLAADGVAVARIGVDARLAERPELVEAVARAASVALDNARLQAELRAQQHEAVESRHRLDSSEEDRRQLSRLVPGGLADRLRADPTAFTKTTRHRVTVLMSDIRGYTAIAETSDAELLADRLNEHRKEMNAAILAERGTVMQYVGDAVLAVFGAPEPLDDHAGRALRAAAAMHQAQARLDVAWAGQGLEPFGLGIGVSTGDVAAAFLGSAERVEYTVVGDTVNLAARLTDAARPAGTTVASAATVIGAGSAWDVEELPPFQVKGRTASVSACRVLGAQRATEPA